MRSPRSLKKENSPLLRHNLLRGGYTLLEIAVVLAIVGMFVGSGLQVLKLYNKNKAFRSTDVNMTSLIIKFQEYLDSNGHYPCPAPLDATRGDATYGMESDCDDTSIPVGTCQDGLCIEQSATLVDLDGDDIGDTAVRVRRGAVPFRVLNISEDTAYDGYGGRIEFVATERLSSPTMLADFNPTHGGITLNNAAGTPVTNRMTHILLISRGANQAAAYSRDGVQRSPCPTIGAERENCNIAVDDTAVYVVDVHNLLETNYFDDIMSYRAAIERPLWKATDASKVDITDLVVAGGGVGAADDVDSPTNPKLQVSGVEKDIRAQGDFQTSRICDENGDACFTPDLIAGATGMRCPVGEFMVGIQGGVPQCAAALANNCPAGTFMSGIDAQYRPICTDPPNSCDAANKTFCSVTQALPSAFQGTQITLYAGDTRYQRYRCQSDGSWSQVASGGSCTCPSCTEDVWTTPQSCPAYTSGTRDVTQQRWCFGEADWPPPSPPHSVSSTACSFTATIASTDTCQCNCVGGTYSPGCEIAGYPGSPRTQYGSCPSGFNSGQQTRICPRICNSSGQGTTWASNISQGCTAWDDSACQCTAQSPQNDWVSCPWGFTGTAEHRQKYWNCPGGPSSPGSWDSTWTVVTPASCTCTPLVENRPISCGSSEAATYGFGPGFVGTVHLRRETTCPSPSWTDWAMTSHSCSVLTCSRTTSGSASETSTQFVGIPAGAPCTCGSGTAPCYESLGGGSYQNYYSCGCVPN